MSTSELIIFIVGIIASVCIPLAFLPQTIKIIKSRETKGISIPAYIIYFIGIIAFLVFAVFKTTGKDIPMIVCQTINGLFAITIISLSAYNAAKNINDKSNFLTKTLLFGKGFVLPIVLIIVSIILLVLGSVLTGNALKIYADDIMGYAGAVLISIAFLPQTYKLFKTRDTKGLSLTTTLIYHLGLTLFIIYASLSNPVNYPLLIGNAFGWIVNIILLGLICYNLYQTKKPKTKMNDKNDNSNHLDSDKE